MASISKRGNFWRARIRLDGQVLTRTFDTRDEAEVWTRAEEARIAKGATAVQIKQTPSTMTVADLFDRYARQISPAKKGARWEIIRLKKLAKSFPDTLAKDVDGGTLAEWRDARLKEVSASSVNRELSLISTVYTRAIKEWRLPIAFNPTANVQWPRKPPPRKRRVPDHERAAVLAALGWDGASEPTNLRHWVAWAFVVAIETMMRTGEVLNLTWQHVHLERRHVHLPKTKNGQERDVPLSSKAIAMFRLLTPHPADNAVCPVPVGTFGAYFRRAVKKAGLVDLHFHDSRREGATRLSKKLTQLELMRAIGHTEARSLNVYYQPAVEDLAKKLDED